eukprot:TRINITY_DN43152_c0_g1_i1.p1 TRINITY_DN43152_c0_g1~~TRINITY_DN43152_c0_g1_i1.p1  ORF type:complete len:1459 (-),score=287.25 TRINITY_DN43152_c0_g1_i1:39-4415(-)
MVEGHVAEDHDIGIRIATAFGSRCSTSLRDSVVFGDREGRHIIYPVGRHVAFRHLESGETNFAQESVRVEVATACVTSADKSLFAVCERCTSKPFTQVVVYDLTTDGTKPAQTLEELGGCVGKITCAAFSPDGEATFLCLGSECPEMLLVLLDWRANQVIGKCQLEATPYRIAMSPLEGAVVSVSGAGYLKLFVAVDEVMQVQHDFSGQFLAGDTTVVDHAWIEPGDGSIVVCASNGVLYLLDDEEKAVVDEFTAPFQLTASNRNDGRPETAKWEDGIASSVPCCVRCFSEGFVLGGPYGLVAVWLRKDTDDKQEESSLEVAGDPLWVDGRYCHAHTVRICPTEASIHCLDVSCGSGERTVVAGFGNGNIGHVPMKALKSTGDSQCTIICDGFHTGGITGLDLALHRPILVSLCREENSLCLWNYQTQRCEFREKFHGEEPTGVALHPLGYLLALSFVDKIRLMQILSTELQLYCEFSVRGGKFPRFSHGGHLLAAVHGKGVLVYSTRTLTKVVALRGSLPVTSLSFDADDNTLTMLQEDGSLVEFNTRTWTKNPDNSGRHSDNFSVLSASGGRAFCGAVDGNKTFLRSFHNCAHMEDLEWEVPGAARPCALGHYSTPAGADTILAGTSAGSVWLCDGNAAKPRRQEFSLHVGSVNHVSVAASAGMFATGGEDGTIFILDIRDPGAARADADGVSSYSALSNAADANASTKDGRSRKGGKSMPYASSTANNSGTVMVQRAEIQSREEELQMLVTNNAALQTRLVEDAARLQNETRTRVNEARQKDQEEIQELRLRYEQLQQTSTAKEREGLRNLKNLEAMHMQRADHLEQGFDKDALQASDKYGELNAEVEQLEARWEAIREETQRQLKLQRQRQQSELHRRCAEKDAEVQKLKELIDFTQHRFDMMLDQEAMDDDLEIDELTLRFKAKMKEQSESECNLKKEQDTIKRGIEQMAKNLQQSEKEQSETILVMASLKRQQDELTASLNELKKERREREALLREKELEIGQYKVKVSTLKKFKHVLDYRLREVSHSLQPKDQMINTLNTQLRDLEAEFERQLDVQRRMEQRRDQKVEAHAKALAENAKLQETIKARDRTIFQFTSDLQELVEGERDKRKWPQSVIQIYKKHVDPKAMLKDPEELLPLEELERHIAVMEKKANILSTKEKITSTDFQNDIRQQTQENALLIQEVTELRVEQKALERVVKDLELQVHQAKTKLALERKAFGANTALADRTASQQLQEQQLQQQLAETTSGDAVALEGVFSTSRVAGFGHESKAPQKAREGQTLHKALQQKSPAAVVKPGTTLLHQVRGSRKKACGISALQERKEMQNLLMKADIADREIQMQSLENKLLKDQVQKLMSQRITARSATEGTQPPPRQKTPQLHRTTSVDRKGDQFESTHSSTPLSSESSKFGTTSQGIAGESTGCAGQSAGGRVAGAGIAAVRGSGGARTSRA